MVGMEMRDEEPGQPLAGEHSGHQREPGLLGRLVADAGVDHREAVAILDQVDVDVVEPERQRDPRPEDAGCDLDQLAGRRRFGKGKDQAVRIGSVQFGQP